MLNNISAFYAGGAAAVPTNYVSIQTATVDSGGAASITFSSIPSTYTHLQIRWIARSTTANADGNWIRFNSDSGTNYKNHYLEGNGATASAGAPSTNTYNFAYTMTSSSQTANVFGIGIIDILDYANTNKNKVIRNLGGFDNNGTGLMDLNSGLWISTSAITSIVLSPANGGNYAQYSQIALYGVK